MSDIILTRLALTPQGRRVPVREWHTVIATSTKNGDERALWAWPDPSTILVQAGTPGMLTDLLTGLATVVATGQRHTQFPDGARVRISGLLNPAKSKWILDDQRARVRRVRQAVPERDWPAWVSARLAGAVEDLEVACQPLPTIHAHKPGHTITAVRMAFSGTATVADPIAFDRLIRAGVGPQKAYGCGLILASEAQE